MLNRLLEAGLENLSRASNLKQVLRATDALSKLYGEALLFASTYDAYIPDFLLTLIGKALEEYTINKVYEDGTMRVGHVVVKPPKHSFWQRLLRK